MFELSCIKWQVMTHLVKELKYLCMFLCKYVQDFPEAGVSKKLIFFFFQKMNSQLLKSEKVMLIIYKKKKLVMLAES